MVRPTGARRDRFDRGSDWQGQEAKKLAHALQYAPSHSAVVEQLVRVLLPHLGLEQI